MSQDKPGGCRKQKYPSTEHEEGGRITVGDLVTRMVLLHGIFKGHVLIAENCN